MLPDAGGLLDQDSLFVHLMQNAFRWQNERRAMDEHKQKSQLPRSGR